MGQATTLFFSQAVTSNLILGATDDALPLYRTYDDEGEISERNQRHNLAVTYICPDQWILQMASEPNFIDLPPEKRLVDPTTCQLLPEVVESLTDKEKRSLDKLRY